MRAWERSPDGPAVLRLTSAASVEHWLARLTPVTDAVPLGDGE